MSLNSEQLQSELAEMTELLNRANYDLENARAGSARFQRIISNIPLPVIGCDADGRIYDWNEAAEETFGHQQMAIFEFPLVDLVITPESREAFESSFGSAVSTDQETLFVADAKSLAGVVRTFEWRLTPIASANGQVTSVVLIAVDVTEHLQEQHRLEELANRDGLTGLFNRRAILGVLGESFNAPPCSVILCDVDRFKRFNDEYGHPEGDKLLKRVGEIFTRVAGDLGVPGRYGGEEFIVIVPGKGMNEALELAEQMRAAIEAETTDLNGGATASFGVASTEEAIESPEPGTLIRRADDCLYASKHNGRNQVSHGISNSDSHAA